MNGQIVNRCADDQLAEVFATWQASAVGVLGTVADTTLDRGAMATWVLGKILESCAQPASWVFGRCRLPRPADAVGIYDHESCWEGAADLHQQLAGGRFLAGFQQVIFTDPWAVAAAEGLVDPAIGRWLILDPPGHGYSEAEDRYWGELEAWVQPQGITCIAPASLLRMAPPAFGMEIVREPVEDGALPWLVWDDGDRATDPDSLIQTVERYAHSHRLVVLTRHLPWLADKAQAHLERCAAIFDVRHMDLSAYLGWLSRCSIYVAPVGPPLGPAPLHALPLDAIIEVPEGSEVPQACSDRCRPIGGADGGSPRGDRVESPQTASPAHLGGEMDRDAVSNPGWWSALGSLAQGPEGEAVEPGSLDGTSTMPVDDGAVDLSILVVCFKYLQRFRIFLRSLMHQDHPLERIELCVALPGNPDGVREYLALIRQVCPRLRITEVDIPEERSRHKGMMVNDAFRASSGRVVMVADGDLVLGPDFVRTMLARHRPDVVLGCWRTPLTPDTTARILVGVLDPLAHFEALAKDWSKDEELAGVRQGMLGYCQLLAREAFAAVGYPEEFEGYGQSDIIFIERLLAHGVPSHFMQDYHVLHLSHNRDWTGTKVYL